MEFSYLLPKLFFPLFRMLAAMTLGLLMANILETLHWTRFVAKLATPLARVGRLNEVCAASFTLAFFSGTAANGLLSEAYNNGSLTQRELIFANLFNSCPTFLVHLPSQFFLTYAFLGQYAFVLMGITLSAAILRTLGTLLMGRFFLPPLSLQSSPIISPKEKNWKNRLSTTIKRFKKRIIKLLMFTVPTYCIIYAAQEAGWFNELQNFLIAHNSLFSFIPSQALGIIALHTVAESGVAFSAAASLAASGALTYHQIILALLVGNIVSSPMRAIRHQFPSYAGYFSPPTAGILVIVSQTYKAASLIFVTYLYYTSVFH